MAQKLISYCEQQKNKGHKLGHPVEDRASPFFLSFSMTSKGSQSLASVNPLPQNPWALSYAQVLASAGAGTLLSLKPAKKVEFSNIAPKNLGDFTITDSTTTDSTITAPEVSKAPKATTGTSIPILVVSAPSRQATEATSLVTQDPPHRMQHTARGNTAATGVIVPKLKKRRPKRDKRQAKKNEAESKDGTNKEPVQVTYPGQGHARKNRPPMLIGIPNINPTPESAVVPKAFSVPFATFTPPLLGDAQEYLGPQNYKIQSQFQVHPRWKSLIE